MYITDSNMKYRYLLYSAIDQTKIDEKFLTHSEA